MSQPGHLSPQVPRDTLPESKIALLINGNAFISNRCKHHQSDIFETRLFSRDVYCVSGWRAAEAFYYPDRFTRIGGMPKTTLRLLQDKGSVAVLSGAPSQSQADVHLDDDPGTDLGPGGFDGCGVEPLTREMGAC